MIKTFQKLNIKNEKIGNVNSQYNKSYLKEKRLNKYFEDIAAKYPDTSNVFFILNKLPIIIVFSRINCQFS